MDTLSNYSSFDFIPYASLHNINLKFCFLKYHGNAFFLDSYYLKAALNPVDTGRTLNVHGTSRTSSERLMYVQFTSCDSGKGCYRRFEVHQPCKNYWMIYTCNYVMKRITMQLLEKCSVTMICFSRVKGSEAANTGVL